MDSSEISWQTLFDFFNEKIKKSPSKFNSEEFTYPDSLTENKMRNNPGNLRFHLLRHYIQSKNSNVDLSETSNHKLIWATSKQLTKASFSRTLNLKEVEESLPGPSTPTRKRKRRHEDVDEDYVDDETYQLKKEIERLKRRNEFLEDENRKLRAQKGPFELQSYNKVWPKLCLKSQMCGLSVRQLEKLFQFLRSQVSVLNSIVVPGHTFIHSQRYMIPSLTREQKKRFVINAKEIAIALDGTAFQLQKFMAVLLHNEQNQFIVYGLKHYYQSDNISLTNIVEEILGEIKETIYSKTVMVISDTESATKRSCHSLIEKIMKTERIVDGTVLWGACYMHITGSSEGYAYDLLSSSTKTVVDNISKILGPCGNKYSQNNISQNLKLSCSEENRSEIKIIAEKGCRFYYKTHNARVLFNEYDWLMTFFSKVLETDRHSNNKQLQDIFKLLKEHKTNILLESGLFSCFWVYFISPLWSFFSKPVKAVEAQKVLRNVLAFVENSEKLKKPIQHLTQAGSIFGQIDSFVKEPTDENVLFSEKIIGILSNKIMNGSKIPNKIFTDLENITRSFFGKIQWKYLKEYKSFCEKTLSPTEQERFLIFSNQATESVFGHLKNNLVDQNTSHTQLMHRTELVFNDTLNWAFEQDDSDSLFEIAYKSRYVNKSQDRVDAIENDTDLFDYLYKNNRKNQK